MLHTDKKITALAVFATGNPDFLKAITEISETVRGMEALLMKIVTATITKAFKNAIYHSQPANAKRLHRHFYEIHVPVSEIPYNEVADLCQKFLQMGYNGSDIMATYRFNSGQNKYIYTFYFD